MRLATLIVLLLILSSCSAEQTIDEKAIVVGISYSERDFLNTLYASIFVKNGDVRSIRNPVVTCDLIAANGTTISSRNISLYFDVAPGVTHLSEFMPLFTGIGEDAQGVDVRCRLNTATRIPA